MKKIFLFLAALPLLVFAQDYAGFYNKAAAAYKAGNFPLALEMYTKAHNCAASADMKFRIVPIQIILYQKLKKTAELEKFLERERQNDAYSDSQLRYFLNWNAKIHIWPRRDMRYAMMLLNMARMLQVRKSDNAYYETFFLLGEIYYRNKQYDYLIYYLSPLPEIKRFHPSNSYKISMMLVRAFRAKGDRKQALEWSRKALAYGKKVPYKYNYSEAEKYIKELSK